MEATKQNYQISNKIMAIFAEESCTVTQAMEILAFVSREIRCTSHVQLPAKELVERTDAVN